MCNSRILAVSLILLLFGATDVALAQAPIPAAKKPGITEVQAFSVMRPGMRLAADMINEFYKNRGHWRHITTGEEFVELLWQRNNLPGSTIGEMMSYSPHVGSVIVLPMSYEQDLQYSRHFDTKRWHRNRKAPAKVAEKEGDGYIYHSIRHQK